MYSNAYIPPPGPAGKRSETGGPKFRELGETCEYVETHYYKSKEASGNRYLTAVSPFWVDYAENSLLMGEQKKAFLSNNFADACHNLTEIVACLALLDLPYKSPRARGLRALKAGLQSSKQRTTLCVFSKEIRECEAELKPNIVVAQRYIDVQHTGAEDYVIEEFVNGRVYICEVVVTNISGRTLDFDILMQVPQGSLPVSTSPITRRQGLYHLAASSTHKLDYMFYFPSPGKFSHFPANASINSVRRRQGQCCHSHRRQGTHQN